MLTRWFREWRDQRRRDVLRSLYRLPDRSTVVVSNPLIRLRYQAYAGVIIDATGKDLEIVSPKELRDRMR